MAHLASGSEEQLIRLEVNGRSEATAAPALTALADVLRDELGLTGTKLGCRAGDCGSCTVLVDGVPITSCLMPVGQAEGRQVTTIERISQLDHPLLDSFRRLNASQCGYCIPGIIMAALPLTEGTTTRDEVVAGLAGNLCRCTGYESVVAAIVEAADASEAQS